jgi:hypothetical protein
MSGIRSLFYRHYVSRFKTEELHRDERWLRPYWSWCDHTCARTFLSKVIRAGIRIARQIEAKNSSKLLTESCIFYCGTLAAKSEILKGQFHGNNNPQDKIKRPKRFSVSGEDQG